MPDGDFNTEGIAINSTTLVAPEAEEPVFLDTKEVVIELRVLKFLVTPGTGLFRAGLSPGKWDFNMTMRAENGVVERGLDGTGHCFRCEYRQGQHAAAVWTLGF
jgi:hypothetical protein